MVQLDVEAPSSEKGFDHFVEVIFAKNREDADQIRALLTASAIPSEIESDMAATAQRGVAVLVPADKLVQASEILTVRAEDDDDFIDDDEGDDEDDDYDDDFEDDDDYDDDEEDEEFEDDDEI